MKKRKLLFAAAMLLFTAGAWAQTDVTSTYLTNPSFEADGTTINLTNENKSTAITGWVIEGIDSNANNGYDGGIREVNNNTYAMSNSDGSYLLNLWGWWQGNPTAKQTVNLPAGTYKLAAVVATDTDKNVKLYAGSNHVESIGEGGSVGMNMEVTFSLNSQQEIEIGVVNTDWGWNFLKADNFKLYRILPADVTSTYITNADFSSTTGWTAYVSDSYRDYGNGLIGDYNVRFTPATIDDTHLATEYCFGFECRWSKNYASFNQTTAELPAGYYELTFDVQNVNTKTTTQNYNNLFYVQVGESKITDTSKEWMTKGNVNWTTHKIPFTITEASAVVVSLGYGTGSNNTSADNTPALYVSHLKLEYVPFASSDDYVALNSAISTVEGKAWGFDAGEYAPYNYTEVLQALAEANVIDQTANNSQITVHALTARLNNVNWSANTDEVNAIWDPSFEYSYSTSGNVQPIAWTGTSGHDNATDVRWMWNVSSNAGLAATSSSKALFTKFGVFYGQQNGYTMPLNANTYYTIGFKYGGWSDCKKDGYVTMTDPASASLSILSSNRLPLDAVDGNSTTASWKDYSGIFKTNDAGNYVLGLRKDNESQQSQYAYGDFVLKATTVAEATDYYNAVKDEVDNDYDEHADAGAAKTAFNDAINAPVPSTVAEIMEAAANLYTLRDAFLEAVSTFNALEAELTHAEELGVDAATRTANTASTTTTTAEAETYIQNLKVAEYTAVTTNYPVNGYDIFIGSWTASNFDSATGQHWDGTTTTGYYDKWYGSALNCSISKNDVTLPAGSYVFMAVGRGQANSASAVTLKVVIGENTYSQAYTMKGDTGYGVETSGTTNFSADGTYANTNAGRGWEWRYIRFTLDEATTVSLSIEGTINNSWCSAGDTRLLTTNDNVAVLKELLNAEIGLATAIDKTTNVGEGVFQTPSSAVEALNGAITTAQSVYNNSSATSFDVSDAIADLQTAEETYKTTVNAPADGTKYYIKVATTGHAKSDNAWLLAAGATSNNNPTGYTIQANNAPAEHLAQAWTFTRVSGNSYKISMDLDGITVYLTNGTINGSAAGWKASQIQGTTKESEAMAFKIEAGNQANTFYIYNTETNSTIACQDGGNIYTEAGNAYFSVSEASQASVEVSVKAGKLATRIFPFKPTSLSGVEFYSCAECSDNFLRFEEVTDPVANVPYILYSEEGYNENGNNVPLAGWGTATADTYTQGLLTGVLKRTVVPQNSYVLQTQEDVQAFYKVDKTGAYSSPYRVYVTVPETTEVKAFGFTIDDMETAIEAARAEGESTVTLHYNVAGQQIQNLQKGLNIIKMEDGSVRKVLVK